MKQILAPGSTPTGVGLVLTLSNTLRFTTPCCNVLFTERGQSVLNASWSISTWCSNCETEYTKLMFDSEAVLFYDLELSEARAGRQLRWLAGGLGVSQNELEVTVE